MMKYENLNFSKNVILSETRELQARKNEQLLSIKDSTIKHVQASDCALPD